MKLFINHVCKRLKEESLVQFVWRTGRFFCYRYLKAKTDLRFLIKKASLSKSVFVKNIQDSKMVVNLNDEGLARDLVLSNIREPFSTETMRKELRKGNVVIDIGANIGYYALMESRLVGNKGKIYAIEPVPKNFKLLSYNVKLNNYKNIKLFNLAIGEKRKKEKMHISTHHNRCSMIDDGSKFIGSIMVKTETLDNFIEGKKWPDLIRMDTEGYEYEIIQGMKKILKTEKPLKIFIEIHPTIIKKKKTIKLLTTLKEAGFQVKSAAWEPTPFLIGEGGIMKKAFDFFSNKINTPNLSPGFFKTNIDKLKDLLATSETACHVFFERK